MVLAVLVGVFGTTTVLLGIYGVWLWNRLDAALYQESFLTKRLTEKQERVDDLSDQLNHMYKQTVVQDTLIRELKMEREIRAGSLKENTQLTLFSIDTNTVEDIVSGHVGSLEKRLDNILSLDKQGKVIYQ